MLGFIHIVPPNLYQRKQDSEQDFKIRYVSSPQTKEKQNIASYDTRHICEYQDIYYLIPGTWYTYLIREHQHQVNWVPCHTRLACAGNGSWDWELVQGS